MIASVAFQKFKALRNAHLKLGPFNLVIGPNGSGKTSLIEALLRLRLLAKLPLRPELTDSERTVEGPEIAFRFDPPFDGLEAIMSCVSDQHCDLLQVAPLPKGEGANDWPGLRARVLKIRGYVLDHHAIASPAIAKEGAELNVSAGNLAAVLAVRRSHHPEAFARLVADFIRIAPEFTEIDTVSREDGRIQFRLKLKDENTWIEPDNVSQGTLYLLAMIVLAHDPDPPSIVCIEEIDRGIHPRLLREVRDVLYRLSHPASFGETRPPVQVIATTHSPYLLDLFREHPEEVVISEKRGVAATFSRLTDRPDITAMLEESPLGDMWYSGVLGGVPESE
ncbi:MAG TPA: AAA family ATPase [Opitutaceae bacterium]